MSKGKRERWVRGPGERLGRGDLSGLAIALDSGRPSTGNGVQCLKCEQPEIENLNKAERDGTFVLPMSGEEVIECRPTRWFYLRAGAMALMFGVFLVLFLKDWRVGYPGKNEVYYTYKAFEKAEDQFAGKEWSAEEWEQEASSQKIFPDPNTILPAGVSHDAKWPSVLADYEVYSKAVAEEGSKAIPPLWASYTDKRGWSSSIPKKSYDVGKVQEQLYFGIGSGVLLLVTIFFLVRTSRRSMKVDGDSYYAPGGEVVSFDTIRRIDIRKWKTKGIAYLFSCPAADTPHADPDQASLQKVKVDGMVYGQFREEDGAPAEALFQRILQNFQGELIELEDEEHGFSEENVDNSGTEEESGGV